MLIVQKKRDYDFRDSRELNAYTFNKSPLRNKQLRMSLLLLAEATEQKIDITNKTTQFSVKVQNMSRVLALYSL